MLPMFRVLYQRGDIRQSVLRDLESTHVPPNTIDDYFMNMGNTPLLVFHCRHENDIAMDARNAFVTRADELMLTYLKKAAGIVNSNPQ